MKKLIRLVEAGEKTAFVNSKAVEYRDEKELQDLKDNPDVKSISTAQGRRIKEEVDRKFTTKESITIGKEVVKPLIAALKDAKVEFKEGSKAQVESNQDNTFKIKVTYAKDGGQGVYEFKINPNGAKNELSIKTPDNKFEVIADDVSVPTGAAGKAEIAGGDQKLIDKLINSTAIQKFTSEPAPTDMEGSMQETTKRVGGKYVNYPEKGGERLGTFSTKKAAQKQLAAIEISKHSKNEAARPDYPDLDNDKNTKEPMKKAAQDKKRAMKEDLDIGHQDDEPGMLLGDLYSIMKSTKELYEMVSQFEGQGEVDFPHWWQAKIIKAKSCLQAANQYLDYEVNKPQQVQKVQVVALQEKKGTCCHKCGHVHVKGEAHPTPYLTGKKSCEFRKVNEATTPGDVTATTGKPKTSTPGDVAALAKAQQSATTVQAKSKNINNITEFPGAFEEWMKTLGLEPGRITRGSIEAQVRKMLTKLGYR